LRHEPSGADSANVARRAGSIALATAIVIISCFGMFIGVGWGFGLKCDDSCGTPPPWRDDPNAWQWEAIGILGIAGLVCALVFFAAVALRWRLVAFAALIAWAVLAGSFLNFFDDSGLTSHSERVWGGLVLLVLAGLSAVAWPLHPGEPGDIDQSVYWLELRLTAASPSR
jgi:hypothetical protein